MADILRPCLHTTFPSYTQPMILEESESECFGDTAAALLAEVASLRLQLAQKDALLDQKTKQYEQLAAKHKDSETHATKLEAAVEHRDTVIAQLATSRKLVFEECHRACMNNQAELRQMQDALHRVTRQLQRERREHAARVKEIRRSSKRGPTMSTLAEAASSPDSALPWENVGHHGSDGEYDGFSSGQSSEEESEIVAPHSPPRCSEPLAPVKTTSDYISMGLTCVDEVDFLTW